MAFAIIEGPPREPCRVRVTSGDSVCEFVRAKAYHPADHCIVYCIARRENGSCDVAIAMRPDLPKNESEALALLNDRNVIWFEREDVQPVTLYDVNNGWEY